MPSLGIALGLPFGRFVSPSWTPMALAQLVEWWNIESLAAVGDGNPVSSWAGGKAGITPMAMLTARPTYAADAGDGMPALVTDGVDDSMEVTLVEDVLDFFPGDSLEMWMVFYFSGSMSTNDVNLLQTSTGERIGSWAPFSNNTLYFDTPDFANGRLDVVQPGGFDDAWHVLRFAKHGNERLIELDGVSLATLTKSGNFSSSAAVTFRICTIQTAMKLRHLMYFNDEVAGADLTALRTYLEAWT